jgi:DNA-binding NarL/FixJ family response regulator
MIKLTNQEVRVLEASYGYLPSKEIAANLGLSDKTVNYHLCNSYAKLGVNTRMTAYRKACRLGLTKFDIAPLLPENENS